MVVKELVAKLGLEVDESTFDKAEALIKGLKGGLFGLVAGVGAVAVGLLEMGRETAKAGVEAGRLADRMGVSTDAAQELAFAAEATGSSAESLQTSMFHMSRTIEAAKDGSVEAQKALSGLGVPLQELYKLKPDEQFTRLAGGLAKTSDQGKRAQKAQTLFGRGVVELIPLINKGEEGIRDFREEAHELGVVLSEETIRESKEWALQSHILGAQIDALKYKVGAFVIHGLAQLRKGWTDFKKDHWEQVLRGITYAVVGLTAATIAYGLANAGTLALGLALWTSLGVTAVATGLRMAGAWLLSIAPIAAATIGVVFLGLALEDLYHFFKGDKASLIGKIIGIWTEDIHSFSDFLKSAKGTLLEITDIGGWREKREAYYDTVQAEKVSAAADARRAERGMAYAPPQNGPDMAPIFDPANAFAPPTAAAPPGSGVLAPNFQASFTINTTPGMSPQDVASQVRTTLDDWHHTKVREAIATVE